MSEWKKVDYADAAVAHRNGRHDVEARSIYSEWAKPVSFPSVKHEFRIRERPRTITVTIPAPMNAHQAFGCENVIVQYASKAEQAAALEAIRKELAK